MIEHLDDTVTLDPGISRLDVRNVLVNSINLAWKFRGNDATISAPANFVAYLIQENDKLRGHT